jgi:hypothetical protein
LENEGTEKEVMNVKKQGERREDNEGKRRKTNLQRSKEANWRTKIERDRNNLLLVKGLERLTWLEPLEPVLQISLSHSLSNRMVEELTWNAVFTNA